MGQLSLALAGLSVNEFLDLYIDGINAEGVVSRKAPLTTGIMPMTTSGLTSVVAGSGGTPLKPYSIIGATTTPTAIDQAGTG
jgi:hypothetical protein